jgi:DNA-binding NtrC family response regulator
MSSRIAVVDDEARMAGILAMVLRRAGHTVDTFDCGAALLDELADGTYDLLLTDLKMPEMDGVELTRRARAVAPALPVVLITAHGTVRSAVEAMREGAWDYLEKPVDNDQLRACVARALAHGRVARENRVLRAQVQTEHPIEGVVAESEGMRAALDLARRAAQSNATVLITGESGTGKEVVARAIHFHSPRVGQPFEAVNCKSLNAGVLESELFGHARGAFTGAERARAGFFERADGGTLLLDEIGEIDLDFQGKLLRVLQEGEIQRVGGDRPTPIDVRVLAATNRDLEAEVQAGRFREDLYFRLAVIPVHLPPLRARREDILPLARHLLRGHVSAHGRSIVGWSSEVEQWLGTHDWPGNVRELTNTLERGVVLARGDTIELGDLLLGRSAAVGGEGGDATLQGHLDRAARAHIEATLAVCGGVRIDAARRLEVERTTLYRLMKKYGIE